MNMIKNGSLILALQILLLPASILSITALFSWLTIPITLANFLLALMVTIGVSFLLIKRNKHLFLKRNDFLKVTAVFLILILISLFISLQVYDFSHDGQVYHQAAIIALADGWNPFHQPFLEKYNPYYKNAVGGPIIFVNHYAKASWLTAASLFKLTGAVESGKLFHFLYLAAAFLIALHFLTHLTKVPQISKVLIAALTALNPVVLYQLFSFYNDSQLASLTTIIIILSFQYIIFKDQKAVIFLSITLLTLCNIKFTGLIYGAVIVGISWIMVRIIHKDWQVRFIKYMIPTFLAAVVFIGYQPYITNTVHRGNPFYPAVKIGGEKKTAVENVVGWQAPGAFIKKDRFQKLFYSLFSKADNHMGHMPQLKVPFSIEGYEIEAFKYEDARYGGFGPFFGSVLLVLIAAAPLLFKSKPQVRQCAFLTIGIILISTLINPEAWRARLAPQLWLLPITLIVVFYYTAPHKYITYVRGFAISILLLNVLIVWNKYTLHTLDINSKFKNQVHALSTGTRQENNVVLVYTGGLDLSIRNRLNHFKIRHKVVKSLKDKKGKRLVGTPGARVCIVDIRNQK